MIKPNIYYLVILLINIIECFWMIFIKFFVNKNKYVPCTYTYVCIVYVVLLIKCLFRYSSRVVNIKGTKSWALLWKHLIYICMIYVLSIYINIGRYTQVNMYQRSSFQLSAQIMKLADVMATSCVYSALLAKQSTIVYDLQV